MTGTDHCYGFGRHLGGWQFRSLISHETALAAISIEPAADRSRPGWATAAQ